MVSQKSRAKSQTKRTKKVRKPLSDRAKLLKQATHVFDDEAFQDTVGIAERLLEGSKSSGIDPDKLVKELAAFKRSKTRKLMRRSRKSYYLALARAYSLYLALAARRAITKQVVELVPEKQRKNANLFQEVLRLSIDYTDEKGSRAAAGALARDAGALEWAFRSRIGPKDLLDRFKRGEAGLASMYAEMKKVRRAKKAALAEGGEPLAEEGEADEVSRSVLKPATAPEVATPPEPQLRWSAPLDPMVLLGSTVRSNDALLLAHIDPFSQTITIKRAYLTEFASLDLGQRRELLKLLKDAAVVKTHIRPSKRSKV